MSGDGPYHGVVAAPILLILIIALVFIALIVVIALAATSGFRQAAANRRLPPLSSPARVVDKRSAVAGSQYATGTTYFVTFELPDGQRLELAVNGQADGQLVTGDTGTLFWQGTQFNGFQREILR